MIRKLGRTPLKTKNDYHRPHDPWIKQPLVLGEEGDGTPRRVRNLRSQRRMFTLAVTTFTVGALIIIGSSPYKLEFLAPGPLCSSHAQILEGQGADRCAACHGASNQTVASWLADTLAGGRLIPVSQSDLCMKCHEKSITAEFALNPHSVATRDLKQRTEKFKQTSHISARSLVQSLSARLPEAHGEIACSACHREHHGMSSLTAVTDQQCQTCHSQVYHSFETDHPEFTNWPQQRRSQIAFDHSTHSGKHFPEKDVEFNCSQCHIDGPNGNVKRLASFEQSCADCHSQRIEQSGEGGFAILALPSVDTDVIELNNLNIGSWPSAATTDFDGPIPPAMRLLLYADPVAREVLNQLSAELGSNFEFADIDPDRPALVANAVELVWAMKRLLHDLSLGGQSAIGHRLSQAIGADVDLEQVAALAAELDEPVFKNTIRRWLPDLSREMAEYQAGNLSLPYRMSSDDREGGGLSTEPRRRFVSVKFSKPVESDDEELVENPLANLFSENPAVDKRPVVRTPSRVTKRANLTKDQTASDLKSDSIRKALEHPVMLRNKLADKVAMDPELLAVNPLAAGENTISDLSVLSGPNGPPYSTQALGSVATDNAVGDPEADNWESSSVNRPGWYRDDELFRVFYRPGGHEDRCIKAWSDLIASVKNASSRPEIRPMFSKFLTDRSVGLCATCHTVNQIADGSFDVNWIVEYRDPSIGAFTKFSHQPHTLQPHLRDCSACHDMSQPVSNKDSFVGFDPSFVVSNFAPITKMNCVNCHRQGSTNSGCTHCHSYHIGQKIQTSNVSPR